MKASQSVYPIRNVLSVGYGGRSIMMSEVHDGAIDKVFLLELSTEHLPAASSPGT